LFKSNSIMASIQYNIWYYLFVILISKYYLLFSGNASV
jgi:hypothetical protein